MIPLSISALTNARKPISTALIFSDVKAPTGNSADYCKQAAVEDLGRMGLVAAPRSSSTVRRRAAARIARRWRSVVAKVNDDAGCFLQMVVGGRPLSGSVMHAAGNFGVIPLRDGRTHATAKLLPFDGDEYGVFAFIETVVLVNEAQGSGRLSYTSASPPLGSSAGGGVASRRPWGRTAPPVETKRPSLNELIRNIELVIVTEYAVMDGFSFCCFFASEGVRTILANNFPRLTNLL